MKSTDGGTSPLWAGPFLRSRSVWRRYREHKRASVHLFLSVPDCGWDVTTCIGSCCLAFPTAMESEPGPGAEINPPSPYVALSFITARETKPGH